MIMVALELAKLVMTHFIAFPMEAAPFTETKSLPFLLSNLLLTQSLGWHGPGSWNDPAWSISVEFWSYILFGLVALAVRRHALVVMSLIGALALAGLVAFAPGQIISSMIRASCAPCSISIRACGPIAPFPCGAAPFGSLVEIAVVGLEMLYLCVMKQEEATVWFVPVFFSCLIYVFSQSREIFFRILESRPLQALGGWAYSVYIFHMVIYYIAVVFMRFLIDLAKFPLILKNDALIRIFSTGSPSFDLLIWAILIGVVVVISSVSNRWIERFGMALGFWLSDGIKPGEGAASS